MSQHEHIEKLKDAADEIEGTEEGVIPEGASTLRHAL